MSARVVAEICSNLLRGRRRTRGLLEARCLISIGPVHGGRAWPRARLRQGGVVRGGLPSPSPIANRSSGDERAPLRVPGECLPEGTALPPASDAGFPWLQSASDAGQSLSARRLRRSRAPGAQAIGTAGREGAAPYAEEHLRRGRGGGEDVAPFGDGVSRE
jgi:hypothetical protein